MREFCVGDTNMLVSKNAKICVIPYAIAKICNANPQREQVEYRSPWVPSVKFWHGHVDFICLCHFHLHWVGNTNIISSVIWALHCLPIPPFPKSRICLCIVFVVIIFVYICINVTITVLSSEELCICREKTK